MPFILDLPPDTDFKQTKMEFVNTESIENGSLDIFDEVKTFNLDDDFIENVFITDKVDLLIKAWENNTMFSSSISKIVNDDNFKRIVELGEKAIPHIIKEIEVNPSPLVWALNYITQSSLFSSQRLTITDTCKKWVKLYKSGLINL